MPQVIFAPVAMLDLARLSAFLHAKSAASARRVAAITKSVQTLFVHPQIGRPLPDLEPQYRELLVEFGSSGYPVLPYRRRFRGRAGVAPSA